MSLFRGIPQLLLIFTFCIILVSCGTKKQQYTYNPHPKREFRGAWVQTAWQGQYQAMNSGQMRQYFSDMLDRFQETGINAVIFQVRPHADALYKSSLEPWSSVLTGKQGKGLPDGFDPLEFMVEECHKRGIELHAWLNPYRVTLNESQTLAPDHIYHKHPERFVKYGSQILFDPGIPENREFICQVVSDIVNRYEVDAIHMDDYFYPYPIAGKEFPDNGSFAKYGKLQGFPDNEKDNWRRNNVNMLVKDIKETIVIAKPWVRFGISPFGIYRNKKNTPNGTGSETNGLQNYDDLYADVKLWVKNGWIDYNIPQLYWEIGHKSADFATLIKWWNDNNFEQPLYIGQDVNRMMDVPMPSKGGNQLEEKIRLSRDFHNIHGNCFWHAYSILDNYRGFCNETKTKYHKYPALIPAYSHMHKKKPKKVKNLRNVYIADTHFLTWEAEQNKYNPETAKYFVVYRFDKSEKVDLNSTKNIVSITSDTKFVLPYEGGSKKYKYIVTSVDSFHNESKGKSKTLDI